MKIKVVYDHNIFSWQRYGGISRYIYKLSNLVDKNNDCTANIICPLYINEYLKNCNFVKGVHIYLPKRTEFINSYTNRIMSALYLKCLNPSILHETFYSFKTIAPRGCPTVVTVHDMIHEKFPENFPQNDNTSEKKRIAVSRSAHVICISNNTRDDLINFFDVNPNKITTIYHGYEMNNFNPINIDLKGENKPFLLFVGERGGYKNFEKFIRAYASSTFLRVEFDVIAFGGGAFNSSEVRMFGELALKKYSVRHSTGSDECLMTLYRQAVALVYPSLYEGFGIPPLEAMSFDCPVICSNTSSIPEIVDCATQFFDPNDVDSICDSIEKVVTERDLREKLINLGRERIRFFSWEKCAAETLNVYKGLLS